MRVGLPYGRDRVELDLAPFEAVIVDNAAQPGLADEKAAFLRALRNPIRSRPLRDTVEAGERVVLVIPDITRAFPGKRVLPWLLEELSHLSYGDLTILVGTGTHRANTREELAEMVGAEVLSKVRAVNHSAFDEKALVRVGTSPRGYPVQFNREYVEADKRILLGFIEPHFVAGFSGGYKAVFPGVAGIESIGHYHDAKTIADPRCTWGVLEGNPTQEQVRAAGALAPADFLINLTLNDSQEITEFFCGDPIAAHDEGCAYVRRTVMAPVAHPFPIVVTSNGGYPLDQNLYQSVKGMSAAAQIASPDALIVLVSECVDGFPEHGSFREMLYAHRSARGMLDEIEAREVTEPDQWQVQLFAKILERHRVALYSRLPAEAALRAHVTPIDDVAAELRRELARRSSGPGDDRLPIAVMPQGPYVIPYLEAGRGD